MGRTVSPDDLHSWSPHRAEQIKGRALPQAGEDLQALRVVLPELADTLERINRPMAVALAKEPAAVALKLVSLRSMFPDADILQMIEKRPTILQDEEFGQLQGNLEQLQNALPGADVLNLAAQQPLFLFEDVNAILGEMQSLKPAMALPDIVSLLADDAKFASLLLLRLDVRAQVRQGVPRMRYP
ncbi:g981 [Coccomyxa viridis]|uniref:G981 protein n=1 Tax=Coccomyxa viridis TaxID=1274662 RepID=A0ABP1FM78_9CHLO